MRQPSFTKISSKITYLKLNLNLPGANELMRRSILPFYGLNPSAAAVEAKISQEN